MVVVVVVVVVVVLLVIAADDEQNRMAAIRRRMRMDFMVSWLLMMVQSEIVSCGCFCVIVWRTVVMVLLPDDDRAAKKTRGDGVAK